MIDWLHSRTGMSIVFMVVCALILGRGGILFLRWADHGRHGKSGPRSGRALRCRIGWHKRSMSQRYRDEAGVYHSFCRGCRKPMHKLANGRWVKDGG